MSRSAPILRQGLVDSIYRKLWLAIALGRSSREKSCYNRFSDEMGETLLGALEDRGHALAESNTHRRETVLAISTSQFVQ